MSFYPSKLQTTLAATIGPGYKWARRGAIVSMGASGIIFTYVNALAGFIVLCIAGVVYQLLLSREYYIDSIHKIRTATDLRLRLLALNDSEFPLESLANDAIWRGDTVDNEITDRLAKIRQEKEEAQTNLKNFLDKLTKSFTEAQAEITPPKDEGKPN